MRKNLPFVLFVVFNLMGFYSHARHIVGGEIRMETTPVANQFSFALIQFWDENTLSTGNRDGQVELLFYRKSDNRQVYKAILPYISSRSVNYQNQACASFRSLKTLEGTYNATLTLNPADFNDPGGYYVVWERCCRNDDINNIEAPGSSGMVFYLEFPPISLRNSSPVFSFPNGDYICKDQIFTMQMTASDADGDELRYSLVTPMAGNTSRNNPTGDSSPKSGYPLVQWSPGISLQNIIPGNPTLKIDSNTGKLSVTAKDIGLFVFTIQCEEYRNGKLIGVVRRDFQLLVIECNKNTPPAPVITYNKLSANLLEICPERPITLETDPSSNWSYQWQLNGQNIPGQINPSITIKDTGSYSVVKSFKSQCSKDTSSQIVKVVPGTPPLAVITSETDVICLGTSLDLNANENKEYTYEWKKEKSSLGETKTKLNITDAGMYYVKVQDERNGCTAIDSTKITIEKLSLSMPRQLSVQSGNSVPIPTTVTTNQYPLSYDWSPAAGLNSARDSIPLASPTQTTTYKLTVTSPAGCFVTDTVKIWVFDRMYIPDAFSPNSDGINDVFVIRNGQEQIIDIKIYNRWGEVVFHSEGYTAPWDGTCKGTIVPEGTYIYRIQTNYFTYEGTILVLY